MKTRSQIHCIILTAVLIGALSGCGILPHAPEHEVAGIVITGTAGQPIAGSKVVVRDLANQFSSKTVTNLEGRFQVRAPEGSYVIDVEKPGYASSRVIGYQTGSDRELQIIQRKVANPNWPVGPPAVRVNGVENGDRFLGNIPYVIDIQGANDPQYILVALGKMPNVVTPVEVFSQTPTTGPQEIIPSTYGVDEETTFEVVSYDVNGNRTHRIISILIAPPESEVTRPGTLRALAITMNDGIEYLSSAAARPSQAPPTSPANIYVQLNWVHSAAPLLDGYRVYRSFDGKQFELIATTGQLFNQYADADPALKAGKPVYYRVTAYWDAYESPPTATEVTTPLASFGVELISPSDNERDVSIEPVFRWRPVPQVSEHHFYGAYLWDTLTGSSSLWVSPVNDGGPLYNQTAYRWNEDQHLSDTPWQQLQRARAYEWEVAFAVAVDDLEQPRAISIAVNRFGLQLGNVFHPTDVITPPNPHRFTTRD